MADWIWLRADVLAAVHDEQLAEHGGPPGLRDAGALESALARPRQLAAYGDAPDLAGLAAAYGHGIVKNHPFADGNQRTAFVAVALFLDLNGHAQTADDAACVMAVLQLAAGQMTQARLADWLREHMAPR